MNPESKRMLLSLVLMASALIAACNYGRQPGSTGAGGGAVDSSTPDIENPNTGKDTAFLAKPTPEEALAAWAAAVKTGGQAAHEESSLNEREWSEDRWKTALDRAVQMINANTFSPAQFITHEDLTVVLLKPGGELDRVCLVRLTDGWCVLTSIADWSSMGDDRHRDDDVVNTINGKVLEAQFRGLQGTP